MDKYNEIKKKISKNIKRFRKANNLTQEQLGEMISVSQSTISDYEHGKKLTLPMLYRLSEALDIHIEDLFSTVSLVEETNLFPISKLLNRRYYCYYIDEDRIKQFELKIYKPINSYKACAAIKFPRTKEWIEGTVVLDRIFAIISIDVYDKNMHHTLTFDYYHDSLSEIYRGGLALFTTAHSYHHQAYSRICALSANAIGAIKHSELKNRFLIKNDETTIHTVGISNSLDKQYFQWLIETVNIIN